MSDAVVCHLYIVNDSFSEGKALLKISSSIEAVSIQVARCTGIFLAMGLLWGATFAVGSVYLSQARIDILVEGLRSTTSMRLHDAEDNLESQDTNNEDRVSKLSEGHASLPRAAARQTVEPA